MIDHATVDNLDQLKPLERADLICPEIRALADELIDAIGANAETLAELVANCVEMALGSEEYPDATLYLKLKAGADRRLAAWIKRQILPLAEDRVNARLEQQFEDAQPGLTVEAEDDLLRARDMIAGWR